MLKYYIGLAVIITLINCTAFADKTTNYDINTNISNSGATAANSTKVGVKQVTNTHAHATGGRGTAIAGASSKSGGNTMKNETRAYADGGVSAGAASAWFKAGPFSIGTVSKKAVIASYAGKFDKAGKGSKQIMCASMPAGVIKHVDDCKTIYAAKYGVKKFRERHDNDFQNDQEERKDH